MLITTETSISECDLSMIRSRFISYLRVSTDKQGDSGLGLEAQRAAIQNYITDRPLLAEFVEIESGKNHKNRPQLLSALKECEKKKATLVIAKLDRLARNVAFIANLLESRVDFVAADFPDAGKMVYQMLSVVAEHEREMISQRTKAALAAKKARGCKLGNPRWQESVGKAAAARRVPPPTDLVLNRIVTMRRAGKPLWAIAEDLNENKIKTSTNGRWHPETIRRVLGQYQEAPKTNADSSPNR